MICDCGWQTIVANLSGQGKKQQLQETNNLSCIYQTQKPVLLLTFLGSEGTTT